MVHRGCAAEGRRQLGHGEGMAPGLCCWQEGGKEECLGYAQPRRMWPEEQDFGHDEEENGCVLGWECCRDRRWSDLARLLMELCRSEGGVVQKVG